MGSLFLEGLLLQASLIFALGAQNLFVLESGLKRQHHLTVSFVCFACDLTLILIGVAGAATLFTKFPEVKILVGILGAFFMFVYGVSKIFSADSKHIRQCDLGGTLRKSILLSLTFSVLNPHAYLDAFILIGGFSAKYSALEDRLMLGLGAGIYSGLWFLVLSTMSSVMRPVLENPFRMKIIMSVAGLALVFLSGKLGLDVMGWIELEYSSSLAYRFPAYPRAPGILYTTFLY